MKELTINEMKGITGGAISPIIWGLIAAGISFLGGLLDGYTRPYKCR